MALETGYTRTMDERTRLINEWEACKACQIEARENPATIDTSEYWANRVANAERKIKELDGVDNATLQTRAAQINEALEDCLDQKVGMALLEELAEIENKLARDGERMDDAADNYADARRGAKYKVPNLDPEDYFIIPVNRRDQVMLTHKGQRKLAKQEIK